MTVLPVLVDATSVPVGRGGVARYLGGLLQGLDELGAAVHVVAKERDLPWLRGLAPRHAYVTAPGVVGRRPVRLLWEQVGLPILARRLAVRRVLSPHYTFPLLLAARCVVTLHDATFFSDPAAHGRVKRIFFRTWTRAARARAAATVTPSASTASELDRFVGGRTPNQVAHLGVDRDVFRVPSRDELSGFARRHGLDLDRGWVAFLGTVEPRKSVPALIRAHARLHHADPATPPLLVSGGLGWDERAAAELRAAGDRPGQPLRHLGYLPTDDLAAFLGGAVVVAYPSTGEGFGLPVLEGMACGSAVLTTPRTATGEVGGEAVAYTEPDADALERDLGRLLADAARRDELVAAGLERSAGFTWRACAASHLEVLSS